MGGACSKHGRYENFSENLKERNHFEDLRIDRLIILKFDKKAG
jgi:hypothetical protein